MQLGGGMGDVERRQRIELAGTVTRLAADRFLVVTPTVSHTITMSLLRRAAQGTATGVFDATSGLATIGVIRPPLMLTATATSARLYFTSVSPAKLALHSGTSISDRASALISMSLTDSLMPSCVTCGLCDLCNLCDWSDRWTGGLVEWWTGGLVDWWTGTGMTGMTVLVRLVCGAHLEAWR